MGERVYAVHATRPEEVGSVEVIFSDEQAARDYAISRSTDHRVVAVSVTEFVIGELGSRHPVAWYRDGQLQDQRASRCAPTTPGVRSPSGSATRFSARTAIHRMPSASCGAYGPMVKHANWSQPNAKCRYRCAGLRETAST